VRSLSVSNRSRAWLVALTLVSSVAAAPSTARADDKQACSAAYAQTQTLRREGKLFSARAEALICMRDVCAEFIRTDCATWFGEIESSQPTVVFEVRDAAGQETSAVRVSLDGKPWLEKLDGSAKAVDPGQHVIRFEIDGAPGLDQTVQIREGEKNRKLTTTFQKTEAPQVTPKSAPTAPAAGVPGPDQGAPETRSIAPWVVGGVGIVGLAVGGILGAVVLNQKSITDEHCDDATLTCDATGIEAANTGRTLGPISTVGFIVGGLGVGVSAVWLLARAPAKSEAGAATVGMGPVMTASGAGWRLQGSW
jgi:hypothetical protein